MMNYVNNAVHARKRKKVRFNCKPLVCAILVMISLVGFSFVAYASTSDALNVGQGLNASNATNAPTEPSSGNDGGPFASFLNLFTNSEASVDTNGTDSESVKSTEESKPFSFSFLQNRNSVKRVATSYSDEWWKTYDFAQDGDVAYRIDAKQTTDTFEVGDKLIFISDPSYVKAYCAKIPNKSAILEKVESGSGFINEENLDFYVSVVQTGEGFDYCPAGSINEGLTEYNCNGGDVRNLSGGCYRYAEIPYFGKLQINLKKDDQAWAGREVKIKRGSQEFEIPETSDGVYSSTHVLAGTYRVYVDGVDSQYDITVNKDVDANGSVTGTLVDEPWCDSFESVMYGKNNQIENVNFHTYKVITMVDDVATQELGPAILKDDAGTQNLHTASETWATSVDGVTTFVISDNDSHAHSSDGHIDGVHYVYNEAVGNTGFTLSKDNRDVTVKYYNMIVNLKSDSVWDNATVTLRSTPSIVRSTLTYDEELSTTEADADGKFVNAYRILLQQDVPSVAYHLYVDGLDVHETLLTSEEDRAVTVPFYTANVTINEDDEVWENANITADNGVEIYTLNYNSTTHTYTENVLQNVHGGSEKPYTLSVSGTIDDSDSTQLTNENKQATFDYYTITYYSYDRNDDMTFEKQSDIWSKQHVRKGSKAVPAEESFIENMVFNAWSEDEWDVDEDKDSVNRFDFTQPIEHACILFAHFKEPEVVINGYIKTDASGAVDGAGACYRLPNTSIAGFSTGDSAIKSIVIQTGNVVKIAFLPYTAGTPFTIEQGSGDPLEVDETTGAQIATSSSVAIVFDEKVSMREAQDYIRNFVVFTPSLDEEVTSSTVQITVSDSNVSAEDATEIETTPFTQTWVPISGSYNGATLSSGYYYLTGDVTSSTTLKISGTVQIWLNGHTLNATGSNGSGKTPGKAAINVSSGNSLYLIGPGSVSARGGNAGNGSNGVGATKETETDAHNGGAGGGGAGAGIGTDGGSGGDGGIGATGNGGATGGRGGTGGDAPSVGSVYSDANVSVSVTGGSKGTGGGGGGNYHCGAGGGGGGGGGAAYAVGTGGGGGGGGGGASAKKKKEGLEIYDKAAQPGMGGYGGGGLVSGDEGTTGTAGDWHGSWYGAAGGRGSGGSASASSIASFTTEPYNVEFKDAVTDEVRTYSFFNNVSDTIFSVPQHNTQKFDFFLGWQLAQVGKVLDGVDSHELTDATNTKRYQPGSSVNVKAYTYGDIKFSPVLKHITGLRAASEVQVVPKTEEETYHTFTVRTTMDGVQSDVGDLVLKDAENESETYLVSSTKEAGKYELTLPSEHTFKIYYNGSDTGKTVESDGETLVPFKSVKVFVRYKTPTYLKLAENETSTGLDVPVLTKKHDKQDGWDEYSKIELAEDDDPQGNFDIIIDGVKVKGKVAQFGTPVYIEYHNVTVNVGGNGAKEVGNNGVVLWNSDHTSRMVATKVAEGVFVANTFSSSDVYTVEVNSAVLHDDDGNDVVTSFNEEHVLHANLNHIYVKVQLDNAPSDVGEVTVNEIVPYKTAGLNTKGSYETLDLSLGDKNYKVIVKGQGSTPSVTKTLPLNESSTDEDATAEFGYYSITYAKHEGFNEKFDYTGSVQIPTLVCTLKGFVEGEVPEREGYSFIGWSTNPDATDPEYTFSAHTTMLTGPITLYPVWRDDPYVSGTVTYDYTYVDEHGVTQIAPYDVQDGETASRRVNSLKMSIVARNAEGDDVSYLMPELLGDSGQKTIYATQTDTSVSITYTNVSGEVVTETYPEAWLHGGGTDEENAQAEAAYVAWEGEDEATRTPLAYTCKPIAYDFGKLPGSYLGSALTYEIRLKNDDEGVRLKWYSTTETPAEADATRTGEQLGKNFTLKYSGDETGVTALKADIDTNFTSGIADRIPSIVEFKVSDGVDDLNDQFISAYYDSETKKYKFETTVKNDMDYVITAERYYVLGKWNMSDRTEMSYMSYATTSIDDSVVGELTYHGELAEGIKTITFADNSESISETVNNMPSSQSIWKFVTNALPENVPTTRGYTFTGWLSANDGKVYQPKDIYPTDEIADDTLTAQWQVNKYKIIYVGLDGANVEGTLPTEYTYDQTTVIENAVEKEGYRFFGWRVNDGDDLSRPSVTLDARAYTSNIKVEAEWGLLTYLTINVDRTFTSPDETRIPEKIEFKLEVKDDSTQDLTFEAPYDDATGKYYAEAETFGNEFTLTPTRYFLNGQWVMADAEEAEHFTYEQKSFAKPAQNKVTYHCSLTEKTGKITFDEGDTGETVNNSPANFNVWANYDSAVPSNVPTARGFTFTGWKSKIDGTIYEPSDVYPTAHDVKSNTLVAQWDVNEYDITYKGLDGANVEGTLPSKYVYNKTTDVNNNVSRSGYRFLGWKINGSDALNLPGATLEARKYVDDIELEAVWGLLTYIDVDVSTEFTSNVESRYPEVIEFQLNVADDTSQNMKFSASFDSSSKSYKTSFDSLGEQFSIEPAAYKIDGTWYDANSSEVKYFTYNLTSTEKQANRRTVFKGTLKELSAVLTFVSDAVDGQNVSISQDKQNIWMYEPATLSQSASDVRGYILAGWKSSRLNRVFQTGQTYPTDTVQDDTLQAQWSPSEYTIHYENVDGASLTGECPTVYKFDEGAEVSGRASKDGYVFNGWKVVNDGDDVHTNSISLEAKKYDSDITLQAVWSAKSNNVATTSNTVPASNGGDNAPLKDFALINFLLTIGTFVLAILFACKRTKWWATDVVLTIVAIVLFVLTTGFDRIVLVNAWTIFFAIIFVLAFIPKVREHFEQEEEEEDQEQQAQAMA